MLYCGDKNNKIKPVCPLSKKPFKPYCVHKNRMDKTKKNEFNWTENKHGAQSSLSVKVHWITHRGYTAAEIKLFLLHAVSFGCQEVIINLNLLNFPSVKNMFGWLQLDTFLMVLSSKHVCSCKEKKLSFFQFIKMIKRFLQTDGHHGFNQMLQKQRLNWELLSSTDQNIFDKSARISNNKTVNISF